MRSLPDSVVSDQLDQKGGSFMKTLPFVAVVLFGLTAGAFAQGVAGSEPSPAQSATPRAPPFPAASVVITNQSKGIRRTMQTTDAGLFSAPALAPSSGYDITVSKPVSPTGKPRVSP